MADEKKDFNAVKVQMKQSQKQGGPLSRSMLYSGINIFGQLSQTYMQNKDQIGYQATQNYSSQMDGGSLVSDSSMKQLSQDVLAIFKKLQKKDSTTKVKAFHELDKFLEQINFEDEELQHLLTFFLYHFCRIITNEPDKKVREAAHAIFSQFIKKGKRKIGPHLKKIFSLWYCSFFDTSNEVASIAKKNFELAFPRDKWDQVFRMAFKNFLYFASEQLRQTEDQVAEAAGDLTKSQKEEVYDRITSCVLLALAHSFDFIKEWPEDEKNYYKKKLIDILDLNVTISEKTQEKVVDHKEGPDGKVVEKVSAKVQKTDKKPQSYLWSFVQSQYRGRVRSSCLVFISSLLQNLPADVVNQHIASIAPLVYNLVGEDSSLLQNTLWKEALFAIGKNFPEAWEYINIKKNFLPKLYGSLKNAAFGAPMALYENFVKFVSVFPFYHLVNFTEDKQNKASFKERANLIRESLSNLYAGLKNDESVAFHKELVGSYFETLTFLILKRLQPLHQQPDVSQDDIQFAMTQFKKAVQIPLEDFLANYEKMISKVQNQRNIRVTIPTNITEMLINLAERQVDKELLSSVCDYIAESLTERIDAFNSIRVITAVMKNTNLQESEYFKEIVVPKVVFQYYQALEDKITDELQDLGRKNIDSFNKKCHNLMKLLYRVNRSQIPLEKNILSIDKLKNLFLQTSKKEEMAKNALGQEDLAKFKTIKQNLLRAVILSINLKQEGEIKEFVGQTLASKGADLDLKLKILLPSQDLRKVNFGTYYQRLNTESHDSVLSFIRQNIIADPQQITESWQLVDEGLSQLTQGQPSYLSQADKDVIAQDVFEKVQEMRHGPVLTSYFKSVKSLILDAVQGSYDNIRELLFDKLLTMRTQTPQQQTLWGLFEQTIRQFNNKKNPSYFDSCLTKLKQELQSMILSKSNYDINAFNRYTQIVKSFVQLGQNKQQIIEDILLQEENFSNLENNSLPLKMFRDLFLTGGVGFDVNSLFSKERENQFVWLAGALLNSKYLPSLSNFIQLQKQLVIFVETEIIPALVNQAQSNNSQFIINTAKYIAEKALHNSSYIYTLEYLIRKMIDPGEEFPGDLKPVLKVDDFKAIFKIIASDTIDNILHKEEVENTVQMQVFLKVLRQVAYFLIDEPQVNELFKASEKYLESQIANKLAPDHKFGVQLEINLSLMNYIGDQTTLKERSVQLLGHLLSHTQSLTEGGHLLNVTLEYFANIMNKIGLSEFKKALHLYDFQNFLTQVINASQEKHLEPLTYIYLLSLVRKTISSELITDKQMLISQVISIAKDHALNFDDKIQKIQQNLQNELEQEDKEDKKEVLADESSREEADIEEFEYEMLQELAETLLIFPSYIGPALDENNLFFLIGSGIESLQKAAFVLLKFLYENFVPTLKYKTNEEEEIKQLMSDQKEAEKREQETQQEESKLAEQGDPTIEQKYKNKVAFRNISEILIELLETPPSFGSTDQEHQILLPSSQIEHLIYGEDREGCMTHRVFGYFLAWNALLSKIDNGRIKSQLTQNSEYQTVLGAINEYLEENYEIYQMMLVSLTAYLPHQKKGLSDAYNISGFEPEYIDLGNVKQNALLSVYSLINFMKSFPSLGRKYYQECDKQILDIVMPFIKQVVSPAILENEIKKIEVAQIGLGTSDLSFSLFKSTKEILATYSRGEIQMELRIRIPNEYPLKSVEVEVSKQLKLSERQLRKWILSIRKILQIQNGDIITAVLLWKSNIDKEVEGVEDCCICYSVVHDSDQSLPKMPCKTCKNKFHVACIRKWFRTSHKSVCPLCQNYFF